mmetsp:Transcript_1933/g.4236  ORF Transcript_1933/g.4236 Transcript_1933/m.4236 type:complete len:255 (-) Transcript_1933:1262-2026(-)
MLLIGLRFPTNHTRCMAEKLASKSINAGFDFSVTSKDCFDLRQATDHLGHAGVVFFVIECRQHIQSVARRHFTSSYERHRVHQEAKAVLHIECTASDRFHQLLVHLWRVPHSENTRLALIELDPRGGTCPVSTELQAGSFHKRVVPFVRRTRRIIPNRYNPCCFCFLFRNLSIRQEPLLRHAELAALSRERQQRISRLLRPRAHHRRNGLATFSLKCNPQVFRHGVLIFELIQIRDEPLPERFDGQEIREHAND